MKLKVSPAAAEWYKDELQLSDDAYVRFFPRYGGVGGIIPGFSIGMNFDQPVNIFTSAKVNNITFFIEHTDAWYFEDQTQLTIEYNDELSEPKFIYDE